MGDGPIAKACLYLQQHKTHNNNNKKTPMPLEGFSHAISANGRPQAKALDRVASEMGLNLVIM